MTMNRFHQPLTEAMCAIIFMDEDIAKIGKNSVITDNSRESNLFVAFIDSEDKRVFEGTFSTFAWTTHCPVGACKKITDRINIETRRIGTDRKVFAVSF